VRQSVRQSAVIAVSERRDLAPDALGPWAVLVGEQIEGARLVVSAYGPLPREGCVALLEVLGVCAFDEPLVPFRTVIEEEGLTTVVSVGFGHDAVHDLLAADRHLGVDPDERWRRAAAELAERRAAGLPLAEYPTTRGAA